MRPIHLLLVLLVVAIWGFNFITIRLALNESSPFLLNALRFFFASIPAVFFIKPPAIPFKQLILYAAVMFMLQFSLLFIGIDIGVPAGVASLILQVQALFTLLLAVVFFGEKPTKGQFLGAAIAFAGIGLVGINSEGAMTLAGFIIIIFAAIAWGSGNLITKKMGKINMLSLVVWGSFLSWPPLLLVACIVDGPSVVWQNVQSFSWVAIISIIYISYFSTVLGFGTWNWLLGRYPLTTIAPFTLSVPVVAMLSASYLLDEPLYSWKIVAALLVIGGLCINILSAARRPANIS